MFVGEVRRARTARGPPGSCPGEGDGLSRVTNVSKNVHVRRATRRSSFLSAGVSSGLAYGRRACAAMPPPRARPPKGKNGCGERKREGGRSATASADSCARPDPPACARGRGATPRALGLAHGRPFQESAPADDHAIKGADNGVRGHHGFVEKEDGVHQRLARLPNRSPQRGGERPGGPGLGRHPAPRG